MIVQGVGQIVALSTDGDYGKFPDVTAVLERLWIPVGASLLFVVAVVAWLRWWRPVLHDDDSIPPIPRWVWVVPIIMVIAILIGTDYAELADRGALYIVLAAIGALMIGFTEETVFRGVGVTVFRANGYTETKVALWTCVIFGLAHATNFFSEGLSAALQVLTTIAAGFFFYLVRRLGRGLLLAILLHAAWDFSLFSTSLADKVYLPSVIFVLTDIVLVILLLVRRHRLELDGPAGPVEPPAAPAATG